MLFTSRAIVIRTVKYAETSIIAKLYTEKFGMQSYMVRGVRKNTKSAAFKPAQLMNLNLLEIVAFHKQTVDLQNIKEIRCQPALHHLHTDFIKTSIGMFMSEVINKCIVTEEPDEALFGFLHQCVIDLDTSTHSVSLFPCWFLIQLSSYLGFEPKGEVNDNEVFDMENGVFRKEEEYIADKIPYPLSAVLFELQQAEAHSINTTSTSAQRQELLQLLITYYKLHHLNIGEIKSHHVLSEVLGS